MRYDPEKHHRRSIRLKDYDYSLEGAYYVTICTKERLCLFGDVVNGEMQLNDEGVMVGIAMRELSERFENVKIFVHVIMPNHIHGVVQIERKMSVGVPLVGTLGKNEIEMDSQPCDSIDNTENGIDPGTENGIENGIDPGTENGIDNGIDPGTENGIDNGIDPGTENGIDNGTRTGNDIKDKRVPTRGTPTTLGEVIGAFKSITTNEYIRGVKEKGWEPFPGRLWQKNFYEHIIRNDDELNRVCEYIDENPKNWATDEDNPANIAANKKLHGTSP